jgi:hypothetical protein
MAIFGGGMGRGDRKVKTPMVRLRSPQARHTPRMGAPKFISGFCVWPTRRPPDAAHGVGGLGSGILGGFFVRIDCASVIENIPNRGHGLPTQNARVLAQEFLIP